MKLDLRAQRNIFSNSIDILIISKFGNINSIAKPIEFESAPTGEWYEPQLRLKNDEAQALMDELWQCGLRPSEGSGSAGSLAATERHLEDMRKLVFKGK